MYNFTKVAKDFFEMGFIHIPAKRINMENKRFLNSFLGR